MSTRFAVSFNRITRIILGLNLMGPARCLVVLDNDALTVRFGAGGWAFRAHVPRACIVRAARSDRRVTGWGVHGWRGRWLVNGSSRGIVELTIEPSRRACVCGFPVKLRQLRISLEDPQALLAALA